MSPTVGGVQGWEVLDISEFARHRLRGVWSLYHALTLAVGTPLGLGDEALRHLMREGFDTPTVAAYDSMRIHGPLTATAGLNVHPKLRVGPFLLPSYSSHFRTLITHVAVPLLPSPDPGRASANLMAGARAGDAFVSVGGLEAAREFRMGAGVEGGGVAAMGSSAPFTEGTLLRAGFEAGPGRKLLYRVLRNGEEADWVLGSELEWRPAEAGLYRVEVYAYSARLGKLFFRLRPWIFANPVELR